MRYYFRINHFVVIALALTSLCASYTTSKANAQLLRASRSQAQGDSSSSQGDQVSLSGTWRIHGELDGMSPYTKRYWIISDHNGALRFEEVIHNSLRAVQGQDPIERASNIYAIQGYHSDGEVSITYKSTWDPPPQMRSDGIRQVLNDTTVTARIDGRGNIVGQTRNVAFVQHTDGTTRRQESTSSFRAVRVNRIGD